MALLSPPLSSRTASPVFDNGPPLSRGGDHIDQIRQDFGLFDEKLEGPYIDKKF